MKDLRNPKDLPSIRVGRFLVEQLSSAADTGYRGFSLIRNTAHRRTLQ
jgi:hypothetical protein